MEGKLPSGFIVVCNDLGEIEQIIHDTIGIPPPDENKSVKVVFLRLVERSSLDKARAFFTDLRINHRVPDRELTLQTMGGNIKLLVGGVKSGNQFIIVGAQTASDRDKLYAEVVATVEEHKEAVRSAPRRAKERQDYAESAPVPPTVVIEPPLGPKQLAVEAKPADDLENVRGELARAQEELERVQRDFYELATIDSMTGLYNRRHFIKRLGEELRESDRYKRSPAFLLVDLDGFQALNDRYGLYVGDEIIRTMGEITQSVVRKVDMVGRLDADEFGILLIETNAENCEVVARRLQKKLTGVAIEVGGRTFRVTVSLALVYIGNTKTTADKLLRQAERLIQKAKESGGNQVVKE